jgi:hypothetical protein
MDKMSIEVAEAKKQLNFFDFGRTWPFCDALYFGGIHADVSCGDNNSEVFNGGLIKRTFFWLEVKVILHEAS